MGKVIVIEGTDSSGKQTQTQKLYERLKSEGKRVKKVSFPNYESPASAPVKMYLAGEFGSIAQDVNPYPVSTMFAVDRYASFKKDWEEFYNEGGIIITDRYTTSNMVHQASKIEDKKEKERFLSWLEDLEYEKIAIPRPDVVIFLNMPIDVSFELMSQRKNKITGEDKKDIHERDRNYLKKSYDNACEISKKYGWCEISCVEENEGEENKKRVKSIEEIHSEIYEILEKMI